jgi:hypothetical protein
MKGLTFCWEAGAATLAYCDYAYYDYAVAAAEAAAALMYDEVVVVRGAAAASPETLEAGG